MNVSVDAAQEPLEVYHYTQCLTACAELLHAARLHAGTHTRKCYVKGKCAAVSPTL